MNDPSSIIRPEILTVSRLVMEIRDRLETGFPDVYVEGEVVGFSRPGSGHYYFSLKDENAQIQLVMFRMQNRLIRFTPQDGMTVIARGRVSCYPARGSLQMIVDYMEPKGAGAMAAAFEQRKRELAEKGYFDADRKKAIPSLPFTIGIVTSPTGAALYDALRTAFARHPNLHVILSPSLVQGEGAAIQIARAIELLVQDGRSEVILLIRGGGGAEDLWAFNELAVAEAIHRCPIPIVTGIGHEIDFTIADFCADRRASTPTGAAETTVAPLAEVLVQIRSIENTLIREFLKHLSRRREKVEGYGRRLRVRGLPTLLPAQRVDGLFGRLHRALAEQIRETRRHFDRLHEKLDHAGQTRLQRIRQSFDSLEQRVKSSHPRHLYLIRRQRLVENSHRLSQALYQAVRFKRTAVREMESLLHALGPMNVLERGYSITRVPETKVILTDPGRTKEGEVLEIILHRGELMVTVKETRERKEKR